MVLDTGEKNYGIGSKISRKYIKWNMGEKRMKSQKKWSERSDKDWCTWGDWLGVPEREVTENMTEVSWLRTFQNFLKKSSYKFKKAQDSNEKNKINNN